MKFDLAWLTDVSNVEITTDEGNDDNNSFKYSVSNVISETNWISNIRFKKISNEAKPLLVNTDKVDDAESGFWTITLRIFYWFCNWSIDSNLELTRMNNRKLKQYNLYGAVEERWPK